jgi:hypothetical protein
MEQANGNDKDGVDAFLLSPQRSFFAPLSKLKPNN